MKNLAWGTAALLVLASCGTFRTEIESSPYVAPTQAMFAGKTVGLLPVAVEFASLEPTAVDLRPATQTDADGSVRPLSTSQYLVQRDDVQLGAIGVLDANVLKLTSVPDSPLAKKATELLADTLRGQSDFQAKFSKGWKGEVQGVISNRPLVNPAAVNPPQLEYQGQAEPAFFTDVTILPPGTKDEDAGTDFVVQARWQLRNEVVEALTPQPGQYWFRIEADFVFSVREAKTGKVVVDNKTKTDFDVSSDSAQDWLLPVPQNAFDGYPHDYSRVNFQPFALQAILAYNKALALLFRPVVINELRSVEVKPQ